MLFEREGYPIRAGYELFELPRSTFYYPPVQVDEHAVETAIYEIAGQFTTLSSATLPSLRPFPLVVFRYTTVGFGNDR